MNVAVVGSGFSGIAAAHALASRGVAITILDVGETLDVASRRHRRESCAICRQMRGRPKTFVYSMKTRRSAGIHCPKKVHFGSEYIYASDRSFAPTISGESHRLPYPTFAKAGYSNIWGAAVLAPDSLRHLRLAGHAQRHGAILPRSGKAHSTFGWRRHA